MYFQLTREMEKLLGQMESWFDATIAFGKAKSFDPNTLLTARLAPDMLPLAAQIGIACDSAKLGASRLSGKDAPKHGDNMTTFEEARARVHDVRGYLASYKEADFAGSDEKLISASPRWEGKVLPGADYFVHHNVPNFFFHVTMTYAILRHNGVPLGKSDFLGALPLIAPPA
ncbi:MAG TPA: DUF1993 domain-containing protein [Kofleriaceae bacterium]|jgi:hypothetical protein